MTYHDSVVLAKRLKELSPVISGVELFGSVLRNGHGRDADFLIFVDGKLAQRWWNEEREAIRVRWPDSLYGQRRIVKKFLSFAYAMTVSKRKRKKLKSAADMLGIQLQMLASPGSQIPDFEMFLVPSTWRSGTKVNIEVMQRITDLIRDKNTLGFLKRIARDASRVA